MTWQARNVHGCYYVISGEQFKLNKQTFLSYDGLLLPETQTYNSNDLINIFKCRIQLDWESSCEKQGLSVPKKAIKELKKRIDRAGAKGEKSKLNFYSCSLTDAHVSI